MYFMVFNRVEKVFGNISCGTPDESNSEEQGALVRHAGIMSFPIDVHANQSLPELRFGHATVCTSGSVGVRCFRDDGRLTRDLMHSTDVAMYADKTRRGESR
jgi:hypothetical protein